MWPFGPEVRSSRGLEQGLKRRAAARAGSLFAAQDPWPVLGDVLGQRRDTAEPLGSMGSSPVPKDTSASTNYLCSVW